jgi:rhodanese-related sulfurtransferase
MMTETLNRLSSAVAETPPATQAAAIAHFAGRLTYEADVSDVHADLAAGEPGLVLVDSRSAEAWAQGHVPGALHLPTSVIAERAASAVRAGSLVVTYCWGPGCNGATKAALEFARLGYSVKEMIGGYEYWVREGLPVQYVHGTERSRPDPLTAPTSGAACAC